MVLYSTQIPSFEAFIFIISVCLFLKLFLGESNDLGTKEQLYR